MFDYKFDGRGMPFFSAEIGETYTMGPITGTITSIEWGNTNRGSYLKSFTIASFQAPNNLPGMWKRYAA